MKPTQHKTKPSFADIPPCFLKC